MKQLDDQLILRIEGISQQVEDKMEWLRSMFPDASAWMGDGTGITERLSIPSEDRQLTEDAVEWIKAFVEDGIVARKLEKLKKNLEHKSGRKTVNIQEIMKGKQ